MTAAEGFRYDAFSSREQSLSFEITNDRRSERFRDVISRAFVEMLGPDLPYGPWKVMLQAEGDVLCVVMTGPDAAREEWEFDVGRALDAHDTILDQLRLRFARVR